MDPVAYRLEPLVDAGLRDVEPKQVKSSIPLFDALPCPV